MRSLRHWYLVLIGFLYYWGAGTLASAACPPLSRAGLDAYLKEHGPTEVHFFASWCVECVRHIRESPPKGVIFIATFDERPSAEKVFEQLGGKAPCFFDDGIAEALQVKAVPTIRKMQLP
jgi:hypothetical protein